MSSISILRDMSLNGNRSGPAFTTERKYGEAMPIYALGDKAPVIHPEAFVHPEAVLIGNVTIGAESTIWPGAVLRGDEGPITIGARTSIQDNSVLHVTAEHPTTVGDDCVIGHLVHLEGCMIESGSLVGNAAIVLHAVVVHTGAIVGANSVLLDNTDVPSGALAVGSPAVIKPGRARSEAIGEAVASYIHKCKLYRSELRRIDG